MPLPKPPSAKASLLLTADFEPPVPTRAERSRSTPAAAAPSPSPVPRALPAAPQSQGGLGRSPAPMPVPESPTAPSASIAPALRPAATPAPASAAVPASMAPAPGRTAVRQTRARSNEPAKLFVLDTNVLMHDPMSLFRFEEHDVYLPMVTLEELDSHKKGMSEVARNARQVSRELDALAAGGTPDAGEGIALSRTGHREALGKLYFQTLLLDAPVPAGLPQGKADNQILGVVQALRVRHAGRDVVLVSKDINMRVKARALGLPAEDYFNDKVLEDGDLLYTGVLALAPDFWERHGKTMESWTTGGHTYYRISGPLVPALLINQFVHLDPLGGTPLAARVHEITGKTAVLKTLKDHGHAKNAVWGVTARNREQNFALNLLLDPDVDLVTLTGTAGTGKTLLALAAGLKQVLDDRRFAEIIVTRVTVPLGDDIGFLPGTEEEKMGPWMGALDDNLEVLARSDGSSGDWGRAATNDLVRSKIRIKSLNFMRGRTFLNKYVIIDEAQNLTPKQMKALLTRAGPGTKMVCLGNLAQIDTPYLTEGSSGLTFCVDRFKGWPHSGHLTLARGERSRLADYASDVL
ncbi:MAG: PhoH family protein [Aquabacterium sp.]